MIKFKHFFVCALSCAIIATNTIGVQAATNPSFSMGKAQGFTTAWERTVNVYYGATSGALVGTMIYGYNTAYINEDYVWTQSLSYKARPIVTNSKGTFYGSWKKGSASGYSKIEVQHKGSNPSYAIQLSI